MLNMRIYQHSQHGMWRETPNSHVLCNLIHSHLNKLEVHLAIIEQFMNIYGSAHLDVIRAGYELFYCYHFVML